MGFICRVLDASGSRIDSVPEDPEQLIQYAFEVSLKNGDGGIFSQIKEYEDFFVGHDKISSCISEWDKFRAELESPEEILKWMRIRDLMQKCLENSSFTFALYGD